MKYVFNASPNYRDDISTNRIMRDLTIGLLVVFAFGLVNQYVTYGIDNVIHTCLMMIVSVACVEVCEAIWAKVMKKPIGETLKNSFGWVSAIIFVLMLQSSATIYSVIICSILGIVFSKLLFGGFGFNIFNPAAVARAFVFASFASSVSVDVVSKATPTGTFAGAGWLATSSASFGEFLNSFGGLGNLALGLYPGAIGETGTLVIVLVGIWLAFRKVIDYRVPVTYIATLFVLSLVSGLVQGQPVTYALYHVLTGGAMFGAVFMLTDPVTSPTCASGRIFFAMGAATLTFVIRLGASLPEGVLYSILLMNCLTPLIERLFDHNQIDYKKKHMIYCGGLAVVALVLAIAVGFKATAKDTKYEQVVSFGSSSSSNSSAGLADGKYSGTGDGFGGDVSVEFEVSGGKVSSITITGDNETPAVGGVAIEDIADQITSSGSLEFDAVSGATFTSDGISSAIDSALQGGAQ